MNNITNILVLLIISILIVSNIWVILFSGNIIMKGIALILPIAMIYYISREKGLFDEDKTKENK